MGTVIGIFGKVFDRFYVDQFVFSQRCLSHGFGHVIDVGPGDPYAAGQEFDGAAQVLRDVVGEEVAVHDGKEGDFSGFEPRQDGLGDVI